MVDNSILRFENIVMSLKAPLLDATDTHMSGAKENTINNSQDVEKVILELESRIDELYRSIKSLIEKNGVQPGDSLDTNTLNQVFLQSGVNIGELCKQQNVKEELLRRLTVLLKEYTFTRSREHVLELNVQNTEAPNMIVPNTEE